MRIAVACDHAGFPLKEPLIAALEADGQHVLDLGTFSSEPVDYPDFARAVGNAVRNGFVDVGILVCGSGVGAAIAANKLTGIRAALCHDLYTARQSREEDDANVLCLGARVLDAETAVELARQWLAAEFSGDERHVRRLAKIAELEQRSLPQRSERTVRRQPVPPPPETWEEPAPRPLGERPGAPAATAAAGAVAADDETVMADPGLQAGPPPTARPRPRAAAAESPAAGPPPTPRERFARTAEAALAALERRGFLESLWIKDASLWSEDNAQQTLIRNRLGWLTSPTLMREHVGDLTAFADEIRRAHYTHVLLLGMGGATLCPEVLAFTFGPRMGFPDLVLLDSTHPAAVKDALSRINVPRTLFIVSSKSGVTTETLAFHAFFREEVRRVTRGKPGLQFVAITDPGTPLEKLAKEQGFRRIFLNPPTIGGRFSALSYYGLVPAALAGVDVHGLLDRATAAVEEAGESVPIRDNPGVVLGAKLGAWAKAGRDKITFVLSPTLLPFGVWLEQLLAESLGKNGRGLVPVCGEGLGAQDLYGPDRVFIAMTLGDEADGFRPALDALEAAGHPVVRIALKELLDLGAEFYRWEIATATAGAILEVNPFDEPNVQESKENTVKLLAAYRTSHRLPEWPVDREEDGIALATGGGTKPATVADGLAAHLGLARPGDYLAFLVYLPAYAEISQPLEDLRRLIRDTLRLVVTVGYGPRYLHSTGQLHKGGAPNGLFIQITADDAHDLPIPGQPHSFAVLKNAQALSDLQALRSRGRRIVRVHLGGKNPADTLKKFAALLSRVVAGL
jgi:RpiB/LacA/LacB family sugar-phosphate isomerase